MSLAADQAVTNVARQLNAVRSVGEARAATNVARANLRSGYDMAGHLTGRDASFWASMVGVDVGGATTAAAVAELDRDAEKLELYADRLDGGDSDPVDPSVWGSAAPSSGLAGAIAESIASVYGIEGAAETQGLAFARIPGDDLAPAIRQAPKVFVTAVGDVAEAVSQEVGGAAAKAVWGIFSGFWWLFALVGILIFLLVKYGKKLPFKLPLPI